MCEMEVGYGGLSAKKTKTPPRWYQDAAWDFEKKTHKNSIYKSLKTKLDKETVETRVYWSVM